MTTELESDIGVNIQNTAKRNCMTTQIHSQIKEISEIAANMQCRETTLRLNSLQSHIIQSFQREVKNEEKKVSLNVWYFNGNKSHLKINIMWKAVSDASMPETE